MSGISVPAPHSRTEQQLSEALHAATRNWRLRMVLEGLVRVAIGTLALLVIIALVLSVSSASPTWIVPARILLAVAFAGSLAFWVVRPCLRALDPARLALYLNEHDNSSHGALLAAVRSAGIPVDQRASPVLIERNGLIALGQVRSSDSGRLIERPRIMRALNQLGLLALGAVMLMLLSPDPFASLLRGVPAAWVPPEEIIAPRRIAVQPGDITIPRGASIDIRMESIGFRAEEAMLELHPDNASESVVMPMFVDSVPGSFILRIFDVDTSASYWIHAGGLGTNRFRITVADLPAVRNLDVDLDYPAYTGLDSELFEGTGDVAAVVGTVAELRITLSRPVSSAVARFDDGRVVQLDGIDSLTSVGRFTVRESGFYTLDLTAPDGTVVSGSIRWAVDALPDRAPVVRMLAPGRDTRATNVDETSLEAGSADDYGTASLALIYSINGEPSDTILLGSGYPPGTLEARAMHTLFLDELELVPGDMVAYHALATDGAGNSASSDLYFIEIRPFGRDYRQSEQASQPGGQAGEGQESPQELSEAQRQLVVATFNLLRDSTSTAVPRFVEDLSIITVGQREAAGRVRELVQQMITRGAATADSNFVAIHAALDSAGTAMSEASAALEASRPGDATSPQQRALRDLKRAEALYREVELQLGQQGGGGGGGGGGSPSDLADLFELDTDQLRNQYEAVQQQGSAAAQSAREVDEAAERLRELARRVEEENDRQRRMQEAMQERLAGEAAQGSQSGSGGATGSSSARNGGGAAQRQLAREVEEEARRLERLAREQESPELAQAAQQARAAADALRRSATGDQPAGNQAERSLRQAGDLVGAGQQSNARQRAEEIARRLDEAARAQRRISAAGDSLGRAQAIDRARAERLAQDGANLGAEVAGIARSARELARDLGASDPAASRALGETANRIDETQLPERIANGARFSGDDRYDPGMVRDFNAAAGRFIVEARDQAAEAASMVGTSPERLERAALEQAGDLVRAVESIGERLEGGAGAPAGDPSTAAGGSPRQLRSEVGQRREAAQQLRRGLDDGADVAQPLDEAIAALERLESRIGSGNTSQLAELHARALDLLQQAELQLWRKSGRYQDGIPSVGDPSRMPDRYRPLVEEYFRAIAEPRSGAP